MDFLINIILIMFIKNIKINLMIIIKMKNKLKILLKSIK